MLVNILETAIPDDILAANVPLRQPHRARRQPEHLANLALHPLVPVAKQKRRYDIGKDQQYQRQIVHDLVGAHIDVLAIQHQRHPVRNIADQYHENDQKTDLRRARLLPIPKHGRVRDLVLQRRDELVRIAITTRPRHLAFIYLATPARRHVLEVLVLHQLREIRRGVHLRQTLLPSLVRHTEPVLVRHRVQVLVARRRVLQAVCVRRRRRFPHPLAVFMRRHVNAAVDHADRHERRQNDHDEVRERVQRVEQLAGVRLLFTLLAKMPQIHRTVVRERAEQGEEERHEPAARDEERRSALRDVRMVAK